MFDLVTASGTLPFVVALVVVLMLAIVEAIGAFTGFSASGVIDDWMDVSPSATSGAADYATSLDRFLGWLHFGKVPALILITLFLLMFGVTGLLVQMILFKLFNWTMPALILVPFAVAPALLGTRWAGGTAARYMPRDETQSISQDDLLGRVAVVVLGEARNGSPAQSKVRDRFGRQHYVMVEPDDADTVFKQGDEVLLVTREGAVYRGIVPNNTALSST